MINAIEAQAFDAIICRDETRLGGDGPRTTLLIQDIIDAGGRLFYYFSDEEVSLDDATAKFMVSVRNFAAELEREKISGRTREHLVTKARDGYNAGGRCFGYDNVEVFDGERRVRVEYAINPTQSKIVREIFERYAEGWGLKKIVKDLNARNVAPPRAGNRGSGSWSPSAVHAILRRDRYRGAPIWGKVAKTYKRGTKVRVAQRECDWLIIDAPHLRISDDALWHRVQARIEANKHREHAVPGGRPASYLLSGVARCGACGGPIGVNASKDGKTPVKVYLCQYHRTRGNEVCPVSLRRPVAAVDEVVIDHLARNVLTDDVVNNALKILRRRLTARMKERRAKLLRTEIDNLVAAIATGSTNVGALVQALAERGENLARIEERIRAITTTPERTSSDLRRLEEEARCHVADFRSSLRGHRAQGARLLGSDPHRAAEIHAGGKPLSD